MRTARHMILLFALALSPAAQGETIYFGDTFREVDLRADASTLLLFPAPPLATSCQPADVLRFETLTQDGMDLVERTHLQMEGHGERSEEAEHMHPRIKRMLRATPLRRGETARCSISLASGNEIGATFYLKQSLAKPFVEFRPVGDKAIGRSSRANPGLEILRSVLRGDPLGLFREFRLTRSHEAGPDGREERRPMDFTTRKARYVVSYGGTDGTYSVWKFWGRTRKSLSYDELALLKDSSLGLIFYSALSPEKDFQKGDSFTLAILSSSDVKITEIARVLP